MRWLKYGQAGFYLESFNLLATWASLDELLSLQSLRAHGEGGRDTKCCLGGMALELCAEF